MTVLADTTIRELRKRKLISFWVYNVCRTNNIQTVKQLLEIDLDWLSRLKNVGTKIVTEVNEFIVRYKDLDCFQNMSDKESEMERLRELMADNKTADEISIREINRLELISVRVYNACCRLNITTIGQLLKTDLGQFSRVKNCGRKTIAEINEFIECYKHIDDSNCILDKEFQPIEERELLDAKKKIDLLPPSVVSQLKGWVERRFSCLSVRAKNIFPKLSQLMSVIEASYSSGKFIALDVKKCGKKTAGEIQSFLQDFKLHFEKLTINLDTSIAKPIYSELDKIAVKIGEIYPFLLTKECEVVAEFMETKGIFPVLFIAKLFILRSEDAKVNILRDYYGFNPLLIRYSLSEVGKRNNLSFERVRQIVNKGFSLPKILGDNVRQYLYPLIDDVVAFDSALWKQIHCDNMLNWSQEKTVLLASSLINTHTIIQIADDDKKYLVKKDLIKNVKIRGVLTNITRVVKLRRTTIEQLDILQYIKEEKRNLHKDVQQLCCVYANYLRDKYDVTIVENRYVLLQPNALDISIVIEDILSQSGKPMSLEDMRLAFNLLYPSNALDDVTRLKPYIFRNSNIISKGKTGVYILKSWTNHFTGTLTGYLEHVLKTFNEPILLDDLVEFALEEFPKSNKRSIYTLITGDKEGRFKVYEDDYIGLSNCPVVEMELKEHRVLKRCSFETRFEELERFVTSLKRLPLYTGFEEEEALARWIYNVTKYNTDASEEQVQRLIDFLAEHKNIPQNGFEYKFLLMCDQIKVMVAKSFALPNRSEHIIEYNWLRINLQKYTSYEDNRKIYFEDLLSFLKDFGFYLQC